MEAMRKMVELLDSETLFMEEFKSAQTKVTYMAPAFKQQALIHILDGSVSTEAEFKDTMAELENPLPEQLSLIHI